MAAPLARQANPGARSWQGSGPRIGPDARVVVHSVPMADLLLLQPHTELFDSLKSAPTLPLALLSAARLAAAEFEVELLDQRVERDWRGALAAAVRGGCRAVGITSVTGRQLLHAAEAARAAKELGATVIWGGVHASLLDEQVLRDGLADVVVRGEGEQTLLELMRALARQQPLQAVDGLSLLRDGSLQRTPDRPFADLGALPDVPYHLAGPRYLFSRRGRPTLYLETSRGCPHGCTYCYNTAYHNRRWRGEPADSVLGRIDRALAALPGVRHLSLVDDNFFTDRKRALAIAEGLAERGRDLTFQVQGASVSDLDRLAAAELALLARSGCARLDMGVETGSPRILASVGKQLDLGAVRRVNRLLREHGMVPWYNFMAGFPGETEEDLSATIDLILELTKDNPAALVSPVYCLAPYPGTRIFDQSRASGVRFPEHTEAWAGFSLDRPHDPSVGRARAEFLSALYFYSIFIDGKIEEYDTIPGLALAARLYRPLARWRLERRFFSLSPERRLSEWIVSRRHAR